MQIISHSVKETLAIAKRLAKYLGRGDILCLFGELGSGKTVFVKGVAAGLGIKEESVISPSFVLLCSYAAKIPLYHFDLYRLETLAQILDLGYEEYMYADAITVIEWADRLGKCLPQAYLRIELEVRSRSLRRIKFSGFGRRYEQLLHTLYEDIRN